MILIPIGHEEGAVRRLPWVTFALMGLCLLSLIATGGAGRQSSHDEALERDVSAAMEHYLLHPYLELNPELAELAGLTTPGMRADTLMDVLAEAQELPAPEMRREQQEELDELTATALESLYDHPYMALGLVPDRFSFAALFTHMFMHAGWLHLLGNMLMLYLAGPYIEDVWGRPLYLGFYLLSGISAALLFVALNTDSTIPMVGASGAISGLMGAFLVRYASTRIRFFYLVGMFVRGTFSAPAWVMLPLWLGQQFFMASLIGDANQEGGGVAYWAHIGGFLFGVAVAWGMRQADIEQRFLQSAIEERLHEIVLDNSAVEEAMALLGEGQHEEAARILSAQLSRDPANRDVVLSLWSVYVELGCPQRAESPMLELIQHQIRSGDTTGAVEVWAELERYLPECKVEPRLCVGLAQAFLELKDKEKAAVLLRRCLLEGGSRLPSGTALHIARLGKQVDSRITVGAARLVLARGDVDPETRAELEATLARLQALPVSV